jgi:hypothetical protein
MMGYEARPSAMQVLFYGTVFCLIALRMIWSGRSGHSRAATTSPAPIQPG